MENFYLIIFQQVLHENIHKTRRHRQEHRMNYYKEHRETKNN